MPLTCLASVETAKMSFNVRLCIEGVPPHARQPATLRQLLPQGSLLEGVDLHARSVKDTSCCCLLVWSREPDAFVLEGVLRLEELPDRPRAACHFVDSCVAKAPRPRTIPVRTIGHEVLLHIDQIIDFRPPSDVSMEWPERHTFH
jgi:hypothetical protein